MIELLYSSSPANKYVLKFNNRNIDNKKMFKVGNKDIRTMSMTSFWCLQWKIFGGQNSRGNCPRDNFMGCNRGKLFRGNYPGGKVREVIVLGGISYGSIVLGVIVRQELFKGSFCWFFFCTWENFIGGNCPRGSVLGKGRLDTCALKFLGDTFPSVILIKPSTLLKPLKVVFIRVR